MFQAVPHVSEHSSLCFKQSHTYQNTPAYVSSSPTCIRTLHLLFEAVPHVSEHSSFCLKQSHMYQNTPVSMHSCVFITTETSFLQTPKNTGKSIHIAQSPHEHKGLATLQFHSPCRNPHPPSKKKCFSTSLPYSCMKLKYTQLPTSTTTIYTYFGLFNDTELIGYIYI